MDAAVTSCPEAPAELRAKALLGSGRLALLQCDYAPAVRRCEAALRLYRELDDAKGIASALQVLGSVAREQGRYARAMELHAESLAVAEAIGRPVGGRQRALLPRLRLLAAARFRPGRRGGQPSRWPIFRELGDIEGPRGR